MPERVSDDVDRRLLARELGGVRVPEPVGMNAPLDPRLALTTLAALLGMPKPKLDDDTVENLYSAESALLQSEQIIPLMHLRIAVVTSPRVKGWRQDQNGDWPLQDVWLDREKP